jgi:chromosome segregation ATPase
MTGNEDLTLCPHEDPSACGCYWKSEVICLRREVEDLTQKNERAYEDECRLQMANAKLRREVERLEEENDELRRDSIQFEDESMRLQGENCLLTSQYRKLEEEKAEMVEDMRPIVAFVEFLSTVNTVMGPTALNLQARAALSQAGKDGENRG